MLRSNPEGIRNQQMHIAINPAGENVFAGARLDLRAPVVVHVDGEKIFAGMDTVGDVKGKACISALVRADAIVVDEDFCNLKSALEFERCSLPTLTPTSSRGTGRGGNYKSFSVPAESNIELGRAEVG